MPATRSNPGHHRDPVAPMGRSYNRLPAGAGHARDCCPGASTTPVAPVGRSYSGLRSRKARIAGTSTSCLSSST